MTICNLIGGIGRLRKATSELSEKWNETRTMWHDQACEEFEKAHLAPLPGRLRMVLAAASELNELLLKAEKECQDEVA
jgi:hypothetical protein